MKLVRFQLVKGGKRIREQDHTTTSGGKVMATVALEKEYLNKWPNSSKDYLDKLCYRNGADWYREL